MCNVYLNILVKNTQLKTNPFLFASKDKYHLHRTRMFYNSIILRFLARLLKRDTLRSVDSLAQRGETGCCVSL